MIKIVEGNLLEAKEDVIVHQVNCKGVMGSGLAKQIRNKYPEIYNEYLKYCTFTNAEDILGSVQYITCHDGRTVANLFGQFDYGRDRRYTSYKALETGLKTIADRINTYKESVALPYQLGCGLAGGDWYNVVYPMINEVFSHYDNVTIYKLK